MSAIFKNAKKKLNQSELRKLMNDHKIKAKDVKKIDSPLAKYPFISVMCIVFITNILNMYALYNNYQLF